MLKSTLMPHQVTALQRAADHSRQFNGAPGFAYFMEQGTGKTVVTLAEADTAFGAKLIQCLIVVAPNGVHRNWVEREAPKHLAAFTGMVYSSDRYNAKVNQLAWSKFIERPPSFVKIAAFNIEAFRRLGSNAEKLVLKLFKKHRCMMVVDESEGIKSPSTRQGKILSRLGKFASIRRILTGTPMTESPLDAYAQFRFLGKELLGFQNYDMFKAHFASWNEVYTGHVDAHGRAVKRPELVKYMHLDQLKELIDAHAYTVTKDECLDLPPKVYEVRPVEMSAPHRALYRRAQKEVLIELERRGSMTIAFAMTRLIRLAQITGGWFAADEKDTPIPLDWNPKQDAVLAFIESLRPDRKVIIWCRFVHECETMVKALRAIHGHPSTVGYWGDIDADDRNEGVDLFQNNPGTRFFVATSAAHRGLTLTAATYECYYSQGYSAAGRMQSEDRAHRIGTTESVTYVDFPCAQTVDELTLIIIEKKIELAELFKDDSAALVEWMRKQERGEG